ncbi:NAD(P)-dependent oxidoreductase [uncultured Paraglaciecola sp.]|uniref:NAD-dependent epimerase/dehydratase family protein n=1 Tax=uncultured Paraglaciecola sp. TaxID=1765024 RepID=UPI0026272941|nr:NAD(P)-dependent oxidoreductase [uncultured Paraglaciecola sp.]
MINKNGPKVVIAGASGFVGKVLTKSLKQSGYRVFPVSRSQSPGVIQVESYSNCPNGDLLIHLAEEPDRIKANSFGDPYLIAATTLTAKLCNQFKGKVIYCSSAVVYGDKNSRPCTELDEAVVSDLYSKIKIQNEKQVIAQGGCVLRLANLFGVGMSPNNVLSDILSQLGDPGPVKLRNTAPVRDFLYIQDLVALFQLLIDDFHPGLFNIGSGSGVSIGDLARIVLSVVEQSQREVLSENSENIVSMNVLDISKIAKHSGWSPRFSLSESVKNML